MASDAAKFHRSGRGTTGHRARGGATHKRDVAAALVARRRQRPRRRASRHRPAPGTWSRSGSALTPAATSSYARQYRTPQTRTTAHSPDARDHAPGYQTPSQSTKSDTSQGSNPNRPRRPQRAGSRGGTGDSRGARVVTIPVTRQAVAIQRPPQVGAIQRRRFERAGLGPAEIQLAGTCSNAETGVELGRMIKVAAAIQRGNARPQPVAQKRCGNGQAGSTRSCLPYSRRPINRCGHKSSSSAPSGSTAPDRAVIDPEGTAWARPPRARPATSSGWGTVAID
jgi:hypothetical protein